MGIWIDPAKGHLLIKGGKFITVADSAQILKYEGGTLGISGGTFSQDMTPYLSSSYCCRKSGAYYVVGSHLYQLKNTSETYLKTEAGCTNPAEYYMSCACGKAGTDFFTYGDPLGHSFTNYVSNDNATCTENGTETASCNRGCGATDEREIPDSAKGHSYQNGKCTVCGDESQCGDHLSWKFDADTGTLTIFGTGEMYTYTATAAAPWYGYADQIETVVLEDGITKIGEYAFYECIAMKSISIPDSVNKIGWRAFIGCKRLEAVAVPDGVTELLTAVFSGCTSLSDVRLPKGLKTIDTGAFASCRALAEINIPDQVTNIYMRAFSGCSGLVSVTIPSRVALVGCYAFEDCTALERVTLAEGVQTISYNAFDNCTNLTEVNLPESLTFIDEEAFYGCSSLRAISIPAKVATIGDSAFHRCYGLESVTFHYGLKTIGSEAFRGCSRITELNIPGSVTKLDRFAFADCTGLTSVTLPCKASCIGNGAFHSCSNLTSVTLSAGIKTIGAQAFQNCRALKSAILPETLETIDKYVFQDCIALESVTFPASLAKIDDDAFMGCTALSSMTFLGDAPSMINGCFRFVCSTAYYPGNNATWTEEIMEDYGGTLTWEPYGSTAYRVSLDAVNLAGYGSVWIDGVEYAVQTDGDNCYVDLQDDQAKTMVAYTYHIGDASDVHSQYPVGMKVWTLEYTDGLYTATYQPDFDNILRYSGMSIRVAGKKGIRMITSIEKDKKTALVSDGLAGYTLKEYGTVVAWDSQLGAGNPLTLGNSYVKSNFAYKKGVADPVFQDSGNLIQYTNVLVNFSNEQCKNDLAMRSYMILEDGQGNAVTLYGGIVRRSIGYIARQNKDIFEPKTSEYQYIWDIIRYVYGDVNAKDFLTA